MRSPAVLGGLGIAILLLLVVLWRPRWGGGEMVPENAGASSVTLQAAPESSSPAHGEAGAAASAPARNQRDAVATATPPGPTCRIRVVDASSRAPVPGARVWLQREDAQVGSPDWNQAMRRFNDIEPVLQSGFSDELTLDARGEVLVPRPARRLGVAANQGELHGYAEIEPSEPDCVVELKAYHSLTVAVVDRSGRPVPDAHVAICTGEFDPLENQWTWTTDGNGRVWIPKLEEQFWMQDYRGQVTVSLAGGVPCTPELALFASDSVPRDPIRLVAGDFGSIVVQLCDREGKEISLEGRAFLSIQLASIPEPSLALRAGADLSWVPLQSGRAVFACVGLDLSFDVNVGATGYDSDGREARGPTEPGQEVRVLIPVGERNAVARGRVRGIPASWVDSPQSEVLLEGHPQEMTGVTLRAWVEEGESFACPIPRSSSLDGLDRPWILELSREGGPVLRTNVVPALEEETRVVDLGDVVFEPVPILTLLRVVDDAGASVSGAAIEVDAGPGSSRLFCDDQGRCALADLPVSVRATRPKWLPSERVRIDTPESETTLVLRRGALLRGRLLLPKAGALGDDLDYVDLALRVEAASPGREAVDLETELVEGNRFQFELCEPGRAALTISYAGHLLFERTGIELVAGRTTELEPIDLGSLLHPFALSFELASGEPWRGGHLEVREPDGVLSTWTTIGPSARASFLAPRASVDVWVAAHGTRPMFFEGVLDGDRLTLPSAPAVELRLSREVRLPEPPLALMLRGERVQPESVEYEDDEVEPAIVREDGTVRLELPWPGEYELSWFVRHTGTGLDFEIGQPEAQEIRVPDAEAAAVIDAQLTRDEVARAVLDAGG